MKKFVSWFKSLFSKIQRLRNKLIPISVKAVQGIKKAIEEGTVDDFAGILKFFLNDVGDAFIDKLVVFLKKHIPEYCITLQIVQADNLSADNQEALIQCLGALNETFGDKWTEFMKGSAGKIAEFTSDGVLDWKEEKELAGDYYDEYIKNAA